MRSHHNIYDDVLGADEEKDVDRHKDLKKDKLTLTECIFALVIALTCVSLLAVFLGKRSWPLSAYYIHQLTKHITVEGIRYIVGRGAVSDSFMGLILVPLVEKFAEHLTAIDEAHDNQVQSSVTDHAFDLTANNHQMNFALAHVLGATIQTALLNSSLVVIVGWGLNKTMVSSTHTYLTKPHSLPLRCLQISH